MNIQRYYKRLLAVSIVIFAIYACLYAPVDNGDTQDDGAVPIDSFCVNELRHRHGAERGLSRQETRKLYNILLDDIQRHIDELNATYSEAQRAIACAHMRSRVRLYSRSRDGTYKIPVVKAVLQMRDAYVHGLRYLPRAIRKDLTRGVRSGSPTLARTRLVLRGSVDCLLPRPSTECPSYLFLRRIREKSDTAILQSCTHSNAYYNLYQIKPTAACTKKDADDIR